MILGLFLAAAVQTANPTPDWSAECLTQVAAAAGSGPEFYDPDWLRRVRQRADGLFTQAHQVIESHRVARESADRLTDALWRQEVAGEVPAGATEIDAAVRDREFVEFVGRFNRLMNQVPACDMPKMPETTMDGRRAERRARLAALPPE